MPYDALTIDTQAVYANGKHLDRGLIGVLNQYKDGLVQVVLSEITLREINSMLVEKAGIYPSALSKAIRAGENNNQIRATDLNILKEIEKSLIDQKLHAREQIEQFVSDTGALVVRAEEAKIKSVLDAYFGQRPPFSNKGKKSEFPDAIALYSLEKWAEETGKKILAVSADTDWQSFGKSSDKIDIVSDLGEAMALLEQHAEDALPIAVAIISAIAAENPPELKQQLFQHLEYSVQMETPIVEFSGPMHGEDEGASLVLNSVEIDGLYDGTTDIEIVRVSESSLVMRVPAFFEVTAFVDINFAMYDTIDKDYVPMGSHSVEREIDFHAYILIECLIDKGASDEPAVGYEVTSAQLIGGPSVIDLEYVDFSLADEEDYYGEWLERENQSS